MRIDKKSVGVVIGLAGVLGLGVVSAQYADIQPRARTFSMTIPAVIPVMQDSTGATIIAKTARLQNNGNDDVVVKSMKLVNGAGYTIGSQAQGSLPGDTFNISVNGTFANDGTGIYDGIQPKIVKGQSTDLNLGVKAGKFSKGGNLGRIEYEFAWNVVGIQITKKPDKLEYNEGESFDKTGIVVETVLGTGGTGERVENITITDGDSLMNGQTSVTVQGVVNGQTFEATIDGITVNKKATITGIKVEREPTDMVYEEGERINKEGMVVRYVMSDGSQGDIVDLSDVQIVDDAPLVAGATSFTIKVVVGGQTYQQSIDNLVVQKAFPKQIDKAKMDAALQSLRGKLTFVKTAYTGSKDEHNVYDISVRNSPGTVYAVIQDNGIDAIIYASGGVWALESNDKSVASTAMFMGYSCSSMDLSGVDFSHIGNARNMFSGTSRLTSIDFGETKFSNLTNAINMFYNSGIPEFDFAERGVGDKLTRVSNMFKGSKIKKVSMKNYSAPNLYTADGSESTFNMFENCTQLTSADLSGARLPNVKFAYSLFRGCSSLARVNLSNTRFASSVDYSYLFYGCTSLASVNMTNMYGPAYSVIRMFKDCTSLQNLDLSYIPLNNLGPSGGGVNTNDGMLDGCNNLQQVLVNSESDVNVVKRSKNFPSHINVTVG